MVEPTDSLEVLFERLSRCVGQHHSPILLSFPPPHGDLPPFEIEILHPQGPQADRIVRRSEAGKSVTPPTINRLGA